MPQDKCQQRLLSAGLPSPRTCQECGLWPCKYRPNKAISAQKMQAPEKIYIVHDGNAFGAGWNGSRWHNSKPVVPPPEHVHEYTRSDLIDQIRREAMAVAYRECIEVLDRNFLYLRR